MDSNNNKNTNNNNNVSANNNLTSTSKDTTNTNPSFINTIPLRIPFVYTRNPLFTPTDGDPKSPQQTPNPYANDKDCLGCQTISTLTLVGAGIYIFRARTSYPSTVGKLITLTCSGALIATGIWEGRTLPQNAQAFFNSDSTTTTRTPSRPNSTTTSSPPTPQTKNP
jgi:hypothetical protein